MRSSVGSAAITFFIKRAVEALDGSDPRVVATIGRHFLEQALEQEPPEGLIQRWLFTVNNADRKDLQRMYYEALANALRVSDDNANLLYEEARTKWATPQSS